MRYRSGPKEKSTTYAVYEYYRDEYFTENDKTSSVKILKFRYGWLPVEIMFETIRNLENKSDKVYKLYKSTEGQRRLGKAYLVEAEYMTYSELHDTLGLENLLL